MLDIGIRRISLAITVVYAVPATPIVITSVVTKNTAKTWDGWDVSHREILLDWVLEKENSFCTIFTQLWCLLSIAFYEGLLIWPVVYNASLSSCVKSPSTIFSREP